MATTPVPLPTPAGLRRPNLKVIANVNTARLALLVLCAVLVLGGACMLYLNLAAGVNTSSSTLHGLTKERRLLEWQKAERERELAQLTHPDRLEARAQTLGFRAPRGVTYVSVAPEVVTALGAKTQTPTTPAKPAATDTGWDTVKSQFNRWLGR